MLHAEEPVPPKIKMAGGWSNFYDKGLYDLYCSPRIIRG